MYRGTGSSNPAASLLRTLGPSRRLARAWLVGGTVSSNPLSSRSESRANPRVPSWLGNFAHGSPRRKPGTNPQRGTEGSNPLPSSSESSANLIFWIMVGADGVRPSPFPGRSRSAILALSVLYRAVNRVRDPSGFAVGSGSVAIRLTHGCGADCPSAPFVPKHLLDVYEFTGNAVVHVI